MRTHILVDSSESLRSDTDNGEVNAIDPHGVADKRGIGRELGPPKVIAKHGDRIPYGDCALFPKETAAQCWLDSEYLEEIVAGHQRSAQMRAVVHGLRHTHARKFTRNQAIEGMRLVAKIAIVRIRDAAQAAHSSRVICGIGADCDHRAWAINGHRPQEQSVSQTENSAVSANAERERQCRNRGESR